MKLFYGDNKLVWFFIDGKWVNGRDEYVDYHGHPIDYNGFAVTGDQIEAVVRNERRGGGLCLDHGVAVQFKCPDGAWHSVAYEANLFLGADSLIHDMLVRRSVTRDPSQYRLLSCDCWECHQTPVMIEAC